MSYSDPVGIFDSGIGGLSILEKIHDLLPNENLIYLADSANAPYGPKGEAFILERSREIMAFFLEQQVKAVVVACNTATAAAAGKLREEYDIPIIGMEPAIKPAAEKSQSGVIGVLATEGTLGSDKFVDLKSRFDGMVEIITQPCPGLVEEIEKAELDTHAIRTLLALFIKPLIAKGADTLVLGCTHYSFIAAQIAEAAVTAVNIIDTDDAVARRLKNVLEDHSLRSEAGGNVSYFVNGDTAKQAKLFHRCLGRAVNLEKFQLKI